MKMSEQINELATAFSKAQAMMRSASKDAKNPFFKSSYATLASVIEALREPFALNGLSFMQPCKLLEDGSIVVETMILHNSGQYIVGEITGKPVKNDPQAVGSLVSYLKRYGLQAMVGIASADDDGEAATGHEMSNNKKVVKNAPEKTQVPPPLPTTVLIPRKEDKLFDDIVDLMKILTNDFADKEKVRDLLKNINVTSSLEIKSMSTSDKQDIICYLKERIEEKNMNGEETII